MRGLLLPIAVVHLLLLLSLLLIVVAVIIPLLLVVLCMCICCGVTWMLRHLTLCIRLLLLHLANIVSCRALVRVHSLLQHFALHAY